MKTLGERIKFARESIKASQQKFADILDISRESIAKYEMDKTMPGGQVFIAIHQHTGINPTWLLLGEGDPFQVSLSHDDVDIVSSLKIMVDSLEKENAMLREMIATRREFNTAQKGMIALLQNTNILQEEVIKSYKIEIEGMKQGEKQDADKSAPYAPLKEQSNDAYGEK